MQNDSSYYVTEQLDCGFGEDLDNLIRAFWVISHHYKEYFFVLYVQTSTKFLPGDLYLIWK